MRHAIAAGKITLSCRVMADETICRVYFRCVGIPDFTVNKLSDPGSLSARGIVANTRDFIITLSKGLGL